MSSVKRMLGHAANIGMLLALLVCVFFILEYYTDKGQQENEIKEIQVIAGIENEPEKEENPKPEIGESNPLMDREIDFYALQEINPDVIGWLYIPDTQIDYPILQASEEEKENYYLRRNLKKEANRQGSLFIQKSNRKDFRHPLSVIYGHNMKSGTMFAGLHEFKDEEYFLFHPYAYIYMPKETMRVKLFSSVTRGATSLFADFDVSMGTGELLNYIKENADTYMEPEMDVSRSPMIGLSTCANQGKRYVVFGYADRVKPVGDR